MKQLSVTEQEARAGFIKQMEDAKPMIYAGACHLVAGIFASGTAVDMEGCVQDALTIYEMVDNAVHNYTNRYIKDYL